MVKDSSSSIKKKRKTAASGDSEQDVDIYKKVTDFEEKEANSRDSEKDATIYIEICQQIREAICKIYKMMQEKNPKMTEIKNLIVTDVCVRVALLKKLNRIDKIQHVFFKDKQIIENQRCDSINLTNQNLVYELHHLLSEINKCKAFKSADEDIELIDFENFMKNAPESLTKKFVKYDKNSTEEKHALRLARLEYELQQRKSLAEQCKSLQEEKKRLAADIVEREKKISALLPLLKNIIYATKPLQVHLDLPTDQMRHEHKLANLLPDPLYIFYANCVSYNTVYNDKFTVTIVGKQEEVDKFNETQTTIQDEEDSEPDYDVLEVEEVVEVKKRRHRKSVQIDPMEEKRKKLFEVFPLSVDVVIPVNNGPTIKITVRYYVKLKIVTILSDVEVPDDITGDAALNILSGENVLCELLPGDCGLESPNPSTVYQLKKVGLGSFSSLVPNIGYAYNWAQGICGLNFLSKAKCSDVFGRSNVEIVMKTLHNRLMARHELAKQLQQLERNIVPKVPANVETPQNSVTSLTKWNSISFKHFCQAECTKVLVEEELVSWNDFYYSATLTRCNAELQAYIVIKNSYPNPPPIIALSLNYKKKHNSGNSDEIREIEKLLNTEWKEDNSTASWLLSAQIMKLCSYMDVFLETYDTEAFPQKAMFLRSQNARNHRRPFKFRKVGTGIFTQY